MLSYKEFLEYLKELEEEGVETDEAKRVIWQTDAKKYGAAKARKLKRERKKKNRKNKAKRRQITTKTRQNKAKKFFQLKKVKNSILFIHGCQLNL